MGYYVTYGIQTFPVFTCKGWLNYAKPNLDLFFCPRYNLLYIGRIK